MAAKSAADVEWGKLPAALLSMSEITATRAEDLKFAIRMRDQAAEKVAALAMSMESLPPVSHAADALKPVLSQVLQLLGERQQVVTAMEIATLLQSEKEMQADIARERASLG